MTRTYDAVVAGHICLDITPSFPDDLGRDPAKVFVPGRLINVGAPTLSTGGAVSNTGGALLRMGLAVELMAKVGDDAFGQIIADLCAAWGATKGLSPVAGEQSSYTCVIAPRGIDRIFFHCPGANDTFVAADVDHDLVAQARLFHFGYPPLMEQFYSDGGEQLATMMAAVRQTGATTSLDMAYPDVVSPAGKAPWPTILERALPHVDIFTPSVEELLLMLDKKLFLRRKDECGGGDLAETIPADDVRRLADRLLELGVKVVLIKCGARGLYLRTAGADTLAAAGAAAPAEPDAWADRELWIAPWQVEVVSATGSGDCAIAGFLAGFLRGATPVHALRLGCVAGALNVQQPDSLSGMVAYDEMERILPTLREKLPLELPAGDGWAYHPDDQLWRGAADRG